MKKKLLALLVLALLTFGITQFYTERYLYGIDTNLPHIPQNVILSQYRISQYIVNIVTHEEKEALVGTAVAIDKHHFLTACHVVAAMDIDGEFEIQEFNSRGVMVNKFPAKVLKASEQDDIALLASVGSATNIATFESELNYHNLVVGDWIFDIGALFGGAPTDIKWGQFTSVSNNIFPNLAQISNVVAPGDSGGGVYNAKTNKLIGIISRGDKSILFVPLPILKKFLLDFNR